MKNVLVLRIHRDFVGRDIPFDKIYFFKRDDEAVLPKVFPSSMVFPVNKRMAEAVKGIIEKGTQRNSLEYHLRPEVHAYNRLSESDLVNAKAKLKKNHLKDVIENPRKYLALVPVLFTKQWALSTKVKARIKKKKDEEEKKKPPKGLGKKVFPQYLVAKKRRVSDDAVKLLKNMMGARSYFIYQGEKIRPICLLCPRSIDSIAGECDLGTDDCYELLGKVTEGDFIKGVKAYWKLAGKIDEPELQMKEASNA